MLSHLSDFLWFNKILLIVYYFFVIVENTKTKFERI